LGAISLPHKRLGASTSGFLTLNGVLDLLDGFSILWPCAAIRPAYRPGPRTALVTAFAWWFIASLGDVTWCSFGLFPPCTLIPLIIGTLPALPIATLVGAEFYKD
jgi:hypothetical protein